MSGHKQNKDADPTFGGLSAGYSSDVELGHNISLPSQKIDMLKENVLTKRTLDDNEHAERKGSITLSIESVSPTESRRSVVDRISNFSPLTKVKDKDLLAPQSPQLLGSRKMSSPHMRLLSRENSSDDGSPVRTSARMSPLGFKPLQGFNDNPFDDISDRDDETPEFGLSKFEYLELQIEKLAAENRTLSEQLVLRATPNVEATITALWNGQACRLDNHKSLPQKMALLDGALSCGDGEAINAVLDFLENTLYEDLFWKLLDERPIAVSHYSRLLSARGDWRPLSRFYTSRGQIKNAIDGILEEALVNPSALDRIVLLREATDVIEKFGDSSELSLDWETKMIEQYMALLVRQQPIEKHDSFLEEEAEDAFLLTYPRNGSLVGTSVAHTLHYCLFYHYLAPEDRLSSHKGIMKAFEVSDRHYTWISVEARAQLQDWEAIKGMFQAKPTALGIFASKKTATVDIPIGIENLIDVLHRHQAPLTVIRKFYSAIQDKQARYLAVVAGEQVDDAIDTWAEMRDMSALKQYLVDIEGGKLGLNSRDITIYGDRIRRII